MHPSDPVVRIDDAGGIDGGGVVCVDANAARASPGRCGAVGAVTGGSASSTPGFDRPGSPGNKSNGAAAPVDGVDGVKVTGTAMSGVGGGSVGSTAAPTPTHRPLDRTSVTTEMSSIRPANRANPIRRNM